MTQQCGFLQVFFACFHDCSYQKSWRLHQNRNLNHMGSHTQVASISHLELVVWETEERIYEEAIGVHTNHIRKGTIMQFLWVLENHSSNHHTHTHRNKDKCIGPIPFEKLLAPYCTLRERERERERSIWDRKGLSQGGEGEMGWGSDLTCMLLWYFLLYNFIGYHFKV